MKYFLLTLFAFAILLNLTAETITVSAVGDIMMANTYNNNMLPEEDGAYLFADAESLLIHADIAIGNLECTMLNGGQTTKQTNGSTVYAFRTPEHYVANLKNAGFDIMNIANNHVRDFGNEGLNRTKDLLDSVGIQYTGFIGDIASMDIHGIKTAVVGYSIYSGMNSLLDIDRSKELMSELDSIYDIIIVTFHGGMESKDTLHTKDMTEYYYNENRGNLIKFSHAVIDAGADLIIGHGPHVPRAMEIYNDRLIAYSLGNFLTYTNVNTQGIAGYAPLLEVMLNDDGTLHNVNVHSFYQKKWHGVRRDPENRAFKLIKKLSIEDFPNSNPFFQ